MDGYTNFPAPTFIKLSPTTDISFNDNFTWIHARHTVKTGVLIARNRKNQNGSANDFVVMHSLLSFSVFHPCSIRGSAA